MYRSLGDWLRLAQGDRASVGQENSLRGRVWLNHCLLLSGLELDDFANKYIYRDREKSRLVKKWLSGKASPTRLTAKAVEKHLPKSLWPFDLPLWQLLRNRPVTQQSVCALAKPFVVRRWGVNLWWFPGDDQLLEERRYVSAFEEDTTRLVYRNDLWGFIGTVIRVRQLEAVGDAEGHFFAAQDMYRSLPGALKQPSFRPHASDLIDCLDVIRYRMPFSMILFDVDRNVIYNQADDPNHEPHRERRRLDPTTHRFVEIMDPILPAKVIPGRLTRSRERTAHIGRES